MAARAAAALRRAHLSALLPLPILGDRPGLQLNFSSYIFLFILVRNLIQFLAQLNQKVVKLTKIPS